MIARQKSRMIYAVSIDLINGASVENRENNNFTGGGYWVKKIVIRHALDLEKFRC